MIKLDTEYESLDGTGYHHHHWLAGIYRQPDGAASARRLQSGLYKAVSDLFVHLRKQGNTQDTSHIKTRDL